MELGVQDRVTIHDPRLELGLVEWTTEPAGMCQLQADIEVVGVTDVLFVRRVEFLPQLADTRLRMVGRVELVGIGSPFRTDGDCFSTPDQLRPAQAEVPPASERVFRRIPVGFPVPPFHRVNTEPVPDLEFTMIVRLCEG